MTDAEKRQAEVKAISESTVSRNVEFRGVDEKERTAEFVISTEAVDRHGTVFKMDGWELEVYNRNPIVCYNHRASGDNPDTIIGTSTVYKEGEKLIGKVKFEAEGENKLADKVWKKLCSGVLKMASVGARVYDWRWGAKDHGEDEDVIYFIRQELLEWSVVSVGSNPDAFKRNAELVDQIKALAKPVDESEKGTSTKTRLKLAERFIGKEK